MIFKNIKITDFDYELAEDRIAKHPLKDRDSSKLLIYNNNEISTSTFSSIGKLFKPSDLLVFNNTKVIQARLLFTKSTGASIEIFLLNPFKPNEYQLAFNSVKKCVWNCVIGNLKRWKCEILLLSSLEHDFKLYAKFLDRTSEGGLVEFTWDNDKFNFAHIVEVFGQVPIPPYLNREPINDDKQRYQTVYAKPEGSVAAPTAGLHFTESVFKSLENNGVKFADVTLHVGAGTFKPVKTETIGEHDMHTEQIYVTKETLIKLIYSNGRTVAVGTTSMRTLESLYWLGVKCLETENPLLSLHINQWDGYVSNQEYSVNMALNALLSHIEQLGVDYLSASTQMIIVPGYQFKMVDVLITNFHQPRSTLLLLVSAFIGKSWSKVYNYALENDFRFLSYGDSSILFRHNE
jgi:S-adenosylmethionine:tRNA ribosyltransferase-isomerase